MITSVHLSNFSYHYVEWRNDHIYQLYQLTNSWGLQFDVYKMNCLNSVAFHWLSDFEPRGLLCVSPSLYTSMNKCCKLHFLCGQLWGICEWYYQIQWFLYNTNTKKKHIYFNFVKLCFHCKKLSSSIISNPLPHCALHSRHRKQSPVCFCMYATVKLKAFNFDL